MSPQRSHFLLLRVCLVAILIALFAATHAVPVWADDQTTEAEAFKKKGSMDYVVGYTIMGLLATLGVLLVCRAGKRKERPDLPQDELEERLRQGQMHQR